MQNKAEVYEWIKKTIKQYREWYQPIDFGNGVIAHRTTPPSWQPRPEYLHHNGGGLAKWNYIIKKHLPPLTGLRVMDLGCNCGLYCIEMSRMGAKKVIGIDRNEGIFQRTSTLPIQDVTKQAEFVRDAFQKLDGRIYDIEYYARDFAKLDPSEFGRFDVIISLCTVYHELERMEDLICRLGTMTDYLVLQASHAHSGSLGRYAHEDVIKVALQKVGFCDVTIDAPKGYSLPVLVGRK